jgi:hypothetical protein
MTDTDLLSQLAAYGHHHRSNQEDVHFEDIIAAGERRSFWRSKRPGFNARGLAIAAGSAALAVVLIGGSALLTGSGEIAQTPADETPATTDTSVTDTSAPPVVSFDAEDPATVERSLPTAETPLPDIEGAALADEGGPPLPLGTVTQLPNEDRLNFLFEHCFEECWRDAHFMDPNDPEVGSGPWPAGRPFHVRHGFVNDGAEPLGPGFDVAVYVFAMDEPAEFEGVTTTGTSRYSSDYVLRGEAEHCGPTYKSQTGPVTCEWFVHDFPDGLPEGRWAIWAVWEAPCSAWVGYGLTESCADPGEVMSFFASGVDSPFLDNEGPFYGEPNMALMTQAEIEEFFGGFEDETQPMGEGFVEPPPPGPEVEVDASGAAATGGTPLPDFAGALPGDDGAARAPLGVITTSTYADRLDFLSELCPGADHCYRDAVFVNPDDPSLVAGPWQADRPFIVRHGFINPGEEPLGDEFDVVVYVYPWDDFGEMGPTTRYTSDYVLRGTTDECGPTYRSLTEPVTCEWFVHEFHDGLPAGRHALWAFWEAPCAAWVDYGFVDACADPTEVLALFASGVDSPWETSAVVWEQS